MPKMKTNRSAAKRFFASGSGKIRRRKAFTSHIMTHKSKKQKRRLAEQPEVHKTDVARVRRLIPGI